MGRVPAAIREYWIRGGSSSRAPARIRRRLAEMPGVSGVWTDGSVLRVRGSVPFDMLERIAHDSGCAIEPRPLRPYSAPATTAAVRLVGVAAAVLLVVDALAQSFEGGTAWRLLSLALALAATLCLARAWRRDRRPYPFAGLNALVALALVGSWVHAGFAAVVPERLPLDGEVGYLAFPLFTLAVYVGGLLWVEAGELLPAGPGGGADDGPARRSVYELANRVALVMAIATLALIAIMVAVWLVADEFGLAVLAGCTLAVLAGLPALPLGVALTARFGLGRLAEHGAMARTEGALPTLAGLRAVVFDKSGTLTTGDPEVVAVEPVEGVAIRDLFRWAAAAEAAAAPGAVTRAARERGIPVHPPAAFRRLPGGGVSVEPADGRRVTIGPDAALVEAGIDNPLSPRGAELKAEGSTPLFVAVDGVLAGAIALSDPLRPEAADVVERVRALDLEVVLLTGDDALAARAVADRLGIALVRAGAEGGAKVDELRALREEYGPVAMVGNGVDDADALARADVGIAVFGADPEAARRASVTLARDSLHAVADALVLARFSLRNLLVGSGMAATYCLALAPVAAGLSQPLFGWLLTPMAMLVLMLLSMATVAVNAARLCFQEVGSAPPPGKRGL
ncbi:HAD-IC family P-type ATPase [Arhodomonas sp. SL1]|uniref:HAD-IC family P-type ATPase n=1 Tax=Arhodomonas sp. SL1 TaxID=3425691 RepID=UPI003F881A06